MNDTKKPKPRKEIKHLARIMGVASHAALSDNLPDWTSRKILKKINRLFLAQSGRGKTPLRYSGTH